MPNHFHLLIDTSGIQFPSATNKFGVSRKYSVTETMRLIKGGTARACNLLLHLTGQFWQHESYDHYIRDEKEYNKITRYIHTIQLKQVLPLTGWIGKITF